ncbi:TaqI-like C-terminal specificity domain-containing protein, partial [uncultured Treponema sp.]|uniref:TaqI-like C-terminal specificity domain-containing protein n=2 Tax=uncultured Treponema sp. TaxID=162155 RepID=UPI00280ADBA8
DAFIISGAKRDEILAECRTEEERRRTDELIRPALRGRDIKRYGYEFADLWLINTHNGIKEKGIPRIDVEKDYPAVKKHLDGYWDKIEKRADQGDTPYNLRNCAYLDDFFKPKIVWGNLNLRAAYAVAPEGMFVNAPCPMIVPADEYLLRILNSKLADYYIRNLSVTRNGGYFEYKPMFIEKLPVPPQKGTSPFSEKDSESQIDQKVYKLYGLSKEEIDFIERQ